MRSTTTADSLYAGLLRRGAAYLVDCALVFGIFASTQLLLFTPLREALGVQDAWFRSGLNTEIYTLLTISIPIWLYFALCEQSAWQATVGKRLLRLRVVDFSTGSRVAFLQSLSRTIVKLLPWELAHLTNNLPEPIWYAPDPEFRIGFAAVGVLMVLYVVITGLHPKKRGPHDLIAGTAIWMRGSADG